MLMNRFLDKMTKNEKGQSMIEFVLFLPFMLMIYSVIINVSGAINASLNQQKVTRAYFYYTLQNNSMFPGPSRESGDPTAGWNTFGMRILGWSTQLIDNKPVAPCFKFNISLGETDGDVCEEPYSGKSTQFIRVGTVYGACGATYQRTPAGVLIASPVGVQSPPLSTQGCELSQ
jgi:hypothetical protein